MNMREQTEKMYGPVRWVDETRGYIECPSIDLHTGENKNTDTMVYLDKVPTIHCVHDSCREELQAENRLFRDTMKSHGWKPEPMSQVVKDRLANRNVHEAQARRLAKNTETVLNSFAWSLEEITNDSAPITNDWLQFLGLWKDDDVIWSGLPKHSGQLKFRTHFRPVSKWKECETPPYNFISTSVFQNESFARSKENLVERRFVVIECDKFFEEALSSTPNPTQADVDQAIQVNMDKSGAVLRYIREVAGWNLKCVIHSANKSIHGWFAYPGEEQMNWAATVLPSLGVDSKTTRPTQPVRTPGIARENGQMQRLLWIR